MFDGNALWRDLIRTDDLIIKKYGSLTYSTFPGLPECLYDALVRSARAHPNKTAIVDPRGCAYSYGRLLESVDDFAGYLYHSCGMEKGGKVAVMLYNSYEFCVSFLAANKLGCLVVPLPSKFRQKEVLSLVEKADPDCIIADEAFFGWFAPAGQAGKRLVLCRGSDVEYGFAHLQILPCRRPFPAAAASDPAILMYTSGTTTVSKGVVLANFNVMHAVAAYERTLGLTGEDSSIIAVPIYHVTGLVAILGLFLYMGGTIYIQKFFQAREVLSAIRQHGITFLHASPTAFFLLLQQAQDFPALPSLRSLACGSSNMPKEKIRQLHQWLPRAAFHTVYGLTETSSPGTVFPTAAALSPYIGSSGLPIPGTVFKIVGEDGRELPTGQRGEVAVKGTVVLARYQMKLPALSDDGWLFTGDIGYFNEAGYLFLSDRKKDMINRGGEKICSYDVENELYQIPGIEEAAVVGIPDDLYGEVAAAVVQCRPESGHTEETLQGLLKTKMAGYKVPARILFVDRIPLTSNSKIDKKAIRAMFAEAPNIEQGGTPTL